MLISKFNKLIRNKFVWGAFAILVAIAFLGFMTPGARSGGKGADRPDAGSLFGKPVTFEELALARRFARGLQQRGGTTEEEREAIENEAWKRLAILRKAADMGIDVTDRELGETITADQAFASDGVFNRQLYRQTIERQLGIPTEMFEAYLREELAIRKMASTVSSTLWIPASEVDRTLSRLSDQLSVQIAAIDRTPVKDTPTVTTEQAQEFYTKHPDMFELPDQVAVRYVSWDISNFLADVSISEDQITDYYDSHLEEFATSDTNGLTVYVPMEEVADTITETLSRQAAVFAARTKATEFAVALAPSRYGDAESLETIAAQFDVPIATTGLFSAWSPLPELNVGSDFNKVAFGLDASDPDTYFSHAITGRERVYIIATETNVPTHIPDFESVQVDALALAQDEAELAAFTNHLDSLRTQIADRLTQGSTFMDAAQQLGFSTTNMEPFAVYAAPQEDIPNFGSVAPAVISLAERDMSDVILTPDQALIAYLVKREAAEFATTQALRPDVQRTLHGTRSRFLFDEWADALLAEARAEEVE